MAKLPFIVEPRLKPIKEVIGTEASGKIEIERRGYLTAAEKAFSQAQMSGDETTSKMVSLCRAVGQSEGWDMQYSYKIVTECMTGEATSKEHIKVNDKYYNEIAEVISVMSSQQAKVVLMNALCMLLYRVDAEFSVDDLAELHPDLIDALNELYQDEEKRSIERLQSAVEEKLEANNESLADLEKK